VRCPYHEIAVELDGKDLLAEDHVVVHPAGPLHVVAELLAGHGVELGIDEVVQPAVGVQVGQEGEGVGRGGQGHQVLERRHL